MKLRVPHPLWIFSAAVVLVVVAVGLCIGVPAYRQRSAIIEIQKYGSVDGVRRVGPEWLRELVGEAGMNAFDEIEGIHFEPDCRFSPMLTGQATNDAVIANVRKLPNLRRLDLTCTRVTDAGMEHVGCLQKLERLDLSDTAVSDASLPLLKRLSNLKMLRIYGTRVTDSGVAELERAFPKLTIER